MVAGSSMGEVIVASLNEEKEDGTNKKLLPSWFGNNKAMAPSSQSVLTNFCAGNMTVTLFNTLIYS